MDNENKISPSLDEPANQTITQEHDKGYKRIFSKTRHFLHFLKKYTLAEWGNSIDETDLVWIDTTHIDEEFKNRESDVIYRAKLNGREIIFYILCELQSSVDHTMPFRLLRYMTLILKRVFDNTPKAERERADYRLPAVVPVVLYNGSDTWTVAGSFKEYVQGYENFGEYAIDFKYFLVDLNRLTDETILTTNRLLDMVFMLDKKPNRKYIAKALQIAYANLQGMSSEEREDLYYWVKYIYLNRVEGEAEKEKILSNFKRGDIEDMMYGIDYLFQDEYKKGEEEANKKARKENLEIAKSLLEVIDFNIIVEKFKLTSEEIKILKGNS
jgi:predicted transposase YdaD